MKDATRTSPVALHYVSVGFIDSCFASCRGTPRQGFLMPSAKALLVLHSDISEHTLEGLANYSHVWVLFHFHKNKIPKDRTKTAKQRAGIQKRKRPRFKAKINPPKLTDGTKVGVFSARTPHRPNAIGLTLVRLEKVDIQKKTLTLSGVDLVHGTPVVDIKPYVPHYDAIPTATVPQWVATSLSTSMLNVEITDQVQTSMANYLKDRKNGGSTSASAATKKKRKKRGTATRTHLYNDVDTMVHAVVEMLQLDMNSGATANKVLQAAKEKETETETEKEKEKEKEVGVEAGKGNSGVEGKARVFYASLDGFKYTCKWYEEQQNIVVVGCEIDHV
jgi:tRNA-Thr(GGU) m(6)t(6)A37 methyltransferase TsaA